MAFENLREQIKDRWNDLAQQIQETSTFNSLRERFESQSVAVQRLIIAAILIFSGLFLLTMPYSFYGQADEYLVQFEENRDLIRGLLRASRAASETPPLPSPQDSDSLRANIESVLRAKRLAADQIGDIQAVPDTPAKEMAPPIVVQSGVVAQVRKLNLAQVLDVANSLQNLGPGTKLIGLDLVQSKDQTHYYDMIAKIVHFGLPLPSEDAGAANRGTGAGRKRNKPNKDEDMEPAE